jgi:hypothetical protein
MSIARTSASPALLALSAPVNVSPRLNGSCPREEDRREQTWDDEILVWTREVLGSHRKVRFGESANIPDGTGHEPPIRASVFNFTKCCYT